MDCSIVLQNKHAAQIQFKDPSCVGVTGSGAYVLQLICYLETMVHIVLSKSLHPIILSNLNQLIDL
jgi:hypothetical protein